MDATVLHNRYRIDAQLGQGGMGVVYRGSDLLLNRAVAIKVLSNSNLGTAGRARLLSEAQAAARLNHPNVVTVYDAGEVDQTPFIVMELIPGETLREHQPQDWSEVVEIIRQVCSALEHAHGAGIIHRDLKPENIIRTPTGTIKLMDFGLARSNVDPHQTEIGAVVGTFQYIAPELLMSDAPSIQSDLYALGVMFYELACGQPPFKGNDFSALIAQHLQVVPEPPSTHNPAIPAAIDALILRLLEKQPADRPATAAEVRKALELADLSGRGDAKAHSGGSAKHNLPRQLTSFIGREHEVEEVLGLLGSHSMVTLTGSGGTGKTRLSLQVAGLLLHAYPDGVWQVELASLSDPEMVAQTTAAVLDLQRPTDISYLNLLLNFLRDKHLLLILDNCEHLLAACASLASILLLQCPKLTILATSREALGFAGEVSYRVPSLDAPNPAQLPLESLRQIEAVCLFVERARAVQPGFQLAGESLSAAARLCHRLDGIPLAIELAAARLSMLTTEELDRRLNNAFRLLTGGSRTALPRHQTLRATIDWSYNLLSLNEQMVLRRLSIFAGGCTLEAAEAVCAGEAIISDEILDILSSLINKSILIAERKQGEETRYRLLETVRQYAHEKLQDAGESTALRDRHLNYILALSEQAEVQLRSAGRLQWNHRLKVEMDNLRTALEWAYHASSRAQLGLRIVTAIGFRFLTPNGYLNETLDWVTKGLALSEGQPAQLLLRMRAYNLIGEVYENQRNYTGVLEWIEKSLPTLRQLGPSAYPDLAWALWNYGHAMNAIHNDTNAMWHYGPVMNAIDSNTNRTIEVLDESIHISRQMGPTGAWYLGMSLYCRSMYVSLSDDLAFHQIVQESQQAFTQSGDRWSVANLLDQLGEFAEKRNDLSEALRCFEEACRLGEEVGDQTSLSYMYLHLGRVHRKVGNFYIAIKNHTGYVELWAKVGSQEAMKEGFVNLGLDWFSLGRSLAEPARKSHDIRAVKFIAAAEKQRSTPYTFLYDPDLFDQVLNTTRREWGEVEFQRVWEEGQAMELAEVVSFALDARYIQDIPDE